MKYFLITLIVFALLFALVLVIGLLLPAQRTETRSITLNAPPEKVFMIVTDNHNWHYRSDLKILNIIDHDGDKEIWEETAPNGQVTRFKTREKIPYSFYAFDMEGAGISGYWTAQFKTAGESQTEFIATEYVQIRNPLLRVASWLLFDLGKFMETYQRDLKVEAEKTYTV